MFKSMVANYPRLDFHFAASFVTGDIFLITSVSISFLISFLRLSNKTNHWILPSHGTSLLFPRRSWILNGVQNFVGVGVPAWLSDIVIYIVGLVLVW